MNSDLVTEIRSLYVIVLRWSLAIQLYTGGYVDCRMFCVVPWSYTVCVCARACVCVCVCVCMCVCVREREREREMLIDVLRCPVSV